MILGILGNVFYPFKRNELDCRVKNSSINLRLNLFNSMYILFVTCTLIYKILYSLYTIL